MAGYALRVRGNTRQTSFSTAGVSAKTGIGHPPDEVCGRLCEAVKSPIF